MSIDPECVAQPGDLVRERELNISIGIVDELDDLGALGTRNLDYRAGEAAEDCRGAIRNRRIVGTDDLWQFA